MLPHTHQVWLPSALTELDIIHPIVRLWTLDVSPQTWFLGSSGNFKQLLFSDLKINQNSFHPKFCFTSNLTSLFCICACFIFCVESSFFFHPIFLTSNFFLTCGWCKVRHNATKHASICFPPLYILHTGTCSWDRKNETPLSVGCDVSCPHKIAL